MKSNGHLWLLIVLVCCTAGVHAQLTPAGTQIPLQATATYTDSSGNTYTAVSNVVTLTVAQVAGVEVTVPVTEASLNPGGSYHFPVTVKNTGNGTDYYHLNPGALPTGWSLVFVEDTNGNGQWESNENTVRTRTPDLNMGAEYKMFVRVTAPANASPGSAVQQLSFSVTSNFDRQQVASRVVSAEVTNLFSPLWTVSVPGGVPGDVTVADGRAIIGSGSGQLYAYWAKGQSAGTEAWNLSLGSPMTGRVSAWGSTLYVPTSDGRVHLVDLNSGSVQKTITVASGVSIQSSPVVQNGVLFVPAQDGRLRAFDANGMPLASSIRWGDVFSSTPSAPGTTHLWAGTGDGQVVCFRSSNLQGVWAHPVSPGVPVTSSPWIDVATNTLFIGGQNGLFLAMNATPDPNAQHVRWVYDAGAAIVGSPFYDWVAGYVYFGTLDGKVYALRAQDGQVKSGYPVQPRDATSFRGMPIVVRKAGSSVPYIYIGSENGMFYAINADNPQELYVYDGRNVGDSFVRSPSLSGMGADDVVVAASANGKVLAFPLK